MYMRLIVGILVCLLVVSCKKDSAPIIKINPQSAARTKFVDTVTNTCTSANPIFATHSGASNFIYLVQKLTPGSYSLYKADDDMNVLLTKTISLSSGELIQIKGSKVSDDIYTLNSTYNFNFPGNTLVNAYVNNVILRDTLSTCNTTSINDYSFENSLNLSSETNLQNNSNLNKFDGSGNLSWSKTLDGNYFESNSLETDVYGNIYVLTANRGGFSPKASTQYTTGSVPYYNYKLDSNQFSLYKFDINGIQIFKKTISAVYEESPGQFTPRLSLSSNNVAVSNSNCIFIFDLNGNLVSSSKPIKNSCINYLRSNVSNISSPFIFIHGSLNYVNGGSNNQKYFVKYSASVYNTAGLNNFGAEITVMDSNQNYYCTSNATTLVKLNNAGTIAYSKPLYFAPYSILTTINNTICDKYNSLYIFEKRSNHILAYKLDSNGNFQ